MTYREKNTSHCTAQTDWNQHHRTEATFKLQVS